MSDSPAVPGTARGFTLIEVLLAVVLLGVSLTVFLNAASQSLAFISEAESYQQARTYLNLLDLQEPLDLDELEPGETWEDSGSLEVDSSEQVRWRRVVTPYGKDEDGFFHLRTDVRWGESYGESIETYLFLRDAKQGGWVQEAAD